MLYDPKWEQKTAADPFGLDSLIAWLEKQPADGVYSWEEPRTCLLGQFVEVMGVRGDDEIAAKSWALARFSRPVGPFGHIVMPPEHWRNELTFGKALARARAERRALTD